MSLLETSLLCSVRDKGIPLSKISVLKGNKMTPFSIDKLGDSDGVSGVEQELKPRRGQSTEYYKQQRNIIYSVIYNI